MEVDETARDYKRDERSELYTYADYASWDDDKRYELIDGVAYMMSSPTVMHQSIIIYLLRKLADYLEGKPCRAFVAPLDICLGAKGDDDNTVVQPDVFVVCDKTKIEKKRINGAPDLIIEIVSPSTSRHDRIRKLNKYLQAGVREYWIVDPDDKAITVHVLENGRYVISAFEETDTISVNILDGCEISLPDVFAE